MVRDRVAKLRDRTQVDSQKRDFQRIRVVIFGHAVAGRTSSPSFLYGAGPPATRLNRLDHWAWTALYCMVVV